jgi:hypothetical protein
MLGTIIRSPLALNVAAEKPERSGLLKIAKPADIAVELPAKFSLKTPKALGLTRRNLSSPAPAGESSERRGRGVSAGAGADGAAHRDREQSRRPHWPIGLLELGEARWRHDIASAPDAGAAALAMRDQYRLAQARGDRRGGVADMDHERAASDRSAVDLFRGVMDVIRLFARSHEDPRNARC